MLDLDLQDEYRQDSRKMLKMKFVKTHETMERLCFVLSLTSLSKVLHRKVWR